MQIESVAVSVRRHSAKRWTRRANSIPFALLTTCARTRTRAQNKWKFQTQKLLCLFFFIQSRMRPKQRDEFTSNGYNITIERSAPITSRWNRWNEWAKKKNTGKENKHIQQIMVMQRIFIIIHWLQIDGKLLLSMCMCVCARSAHFWPRASPSPINRTQENLDNFSSFFLFVYYLTIIIAVLPPNANWQRTYREHRILFTRNAFDFKGKYFGRKSSAGVRNAARSPAPSRAANADRILWRIDFVCKQKGAYFKRFCSLFWRRCRRRCRHHGKTVRRFRQRRKRNKQTKEK